MLAIHRPYLEPLRHLIEAQKLAAMAHITGGGLPGNVKRVLGSCDAVIDLGAWTPPGLFRLLVQGGELDRDEAYRAFNMGIGMVLIVDPGMAREVELDLSRRGETTFRIGHTVAGSGQVRWARA